MIANTVHGSGSIETRHTDSIPSNRQDSFFYSHRWELIGAAGVVIITIVAAVAALVHLASITQPMGDFGDIVFVMTCSSVSATVASVCGAVSAWVHYRIISDITNG